jgi:putative ABC transport system permease protein
VNGATPAALVRLAAASLWNRRGTALLTATAIALSVALLLGVDKLKDGARAGFAATISGTDLVVGARTGPVNLLLYAVFHVGDATAGVSYATYAKVARHPDVEWTIPLSLGDSHRGFRVLGTSGAYFEHYRYGRRRPLAFTAGAPFGDADGAVLGSEVAARLGYRPGDRIVVSHGLGEASFAQHAGHPFRVTGILAPTGTPVDRTVHVSLAALEVIHGGEAGATPREITAFLVGMRSKATVFVMQRALNEYRDEPVLAILPGVALGELWQLVGVADAALSVIAAFVVLAGLLGMMTAILASLGERRREMAVLRSVGAGPAHVFGLLALEAALLALAGALLGLGLAYALIAALGPWLAARYGLDVPLLAPTAYDAACLAAVVLAGVMLGAVPAWRAYRQSLADGLSIRL